MNWTDEGWVRVMSIINNSDYDYSDEFILWLKKNVTVWRGFFDKTVEAYQHKHRHRFGAKAILEILRWESFTRDADVTFKINNNYAPDLARLVMDVRPALKGYFKIRGSATRRDATT